MGTDRIIPSGIDDLDAILGGLLTGDNVVWISDQRELFARVEHLMLAAMPPKLTAVHVTSSDSPAQVKARFGNALTVLDARAGSRLSEPAILEQTVISEVKKGAERVVIDGLAPLARQWGLERAVGFFKRVCPRLFDLGAIAYWRVSRRSLGNAAIEDIRKVTQCVFELSDKQLRILKAEGHSALVQGRLFRVTTEGNEIHLKAEQALGRLAGSLRALRTERNLSQADLARLANVSPSAISQAESGQRGLSLDTLLLLTGALGVGLDDLMENQRRSDYVLARRDRGPELGESRFLLDDPSAGLRVYLVNLDPGEQGAPPVNHKGTELLLVARGLVLVDLGTSSPAVRAGDAIMATKVPILSWRNLAPDPSVVFWILRD